MTRFTVASSAGQRGGFRFAVLDHFDRQAGKGMRRVTWHRTFAQAQAKAKELNARKCDSCGATRPFDRFSPEQHQPDCSLLKFERDPDFGSEFDDS